MFFDYLNVDLRFLVRDWLLGERADLRLLFLGFRRGIGVRFQRLNRDSVQPILSDERELLHGDFRGSVGQWLFEHLDFLLATFLTALRALRGWPSAVDYAIRDLAGWPTLADRYATSSRAAGSRICADLVQAAPHRQDSFSWERLYPQNLVLARA